MTIESKTPVLILSYHNCELYCCHLDGYKSDTAALLRRLAKIEEVFRRKPDQAQFRIWFNMDQNRLKNSTMREISESLGRIQKHIRKISFIGLRGTAKWRFSHALKQVSWQTPLVKAYFPDAELAKEWLV